MEECIGLSIYKDVVVLPNTEIEVKSSVGEWVLHSLFLQKDHIDLWSKEYNMTFDARMAKFRDEPCAIGNYTWNFVDDKFLLEYDKNTKVVTWSYIEAE
jgi:hypothetical protein